MTAIEIGAVIVAVTEAIKRTFPQVNGTITIIVAGLLGLIAGLAGLAGLNWAEGLVVGLSAAGVIKTAYAVSGK